MSNLFTYTKTEGQGWLVEKPEMVKPLQPPKYSTWNEEYKILLDKYNDYLTTLRRFKYDYPDPGKEMELGKDFEVDKRWNGLHEYFDTKIQEHRVKDSYIEIAIPINEKPP